MNESITAAALTRVLIGLALVVAAILLAGWLARRSGLLDCQAPVLHRVGSLSMGPRQRIAVVQIQDTWLVIGVSGSSMQLLHTLPAEPTPDTAQGVNATTDTPPRFARALAQRLRPGATT